MKKLVEIKACCHCPKNYFNTMPDGNVSKGRSWCALSDKELNANKMFTKIAEFCELPDVKNNDIVLEYAILHRESEEPK